MDSADAVRLVEVLISEDRADSERDAVAQLVDLCGALPLAVIVAAERIAAAPDRTVASHVAEMADLGRRMQLLDLDEDDSIGVRAAFTWSYQALPEPAARMFRLLSLHPGATISVSPAAALTGARATEAASLLDSLALAHLLQRTSSEYYRFHDLLKVYAIEVTAAEPTEIREAAVRRLVSWYLHAANAASWALTPARDHHVHLAPPPDPVIAPVFGDFDAAYSWCSRELANFVPVARLAHERGLYFEAWRIMVDLYDFFVEGYPWPEWIEGYEIAIRAAQALGEPNRVAEAQVRLADGLRRRGDLVRAVELDTLVVHTCAGNEPSNSLGWAQLGLGTGARLAGRSDEGTRFILDSVDTFVATKSWFGEATARVALGTAYCDIASDERLNQALEHGRRALGIFLAHGDHRGAAHARLALARSCRLSGDFESALRHCEQAIEDYPVADVRGRAETLHEQALVQGQLGRRGAAVACLRTAIALVEGHDERWTEQLRAELAALTDAPG
jgi:tetratricopeptide (TPR) repeat protein